MDAASEQMIRAQQRAWRWMVISLLCCVLEGAFRKWVVDDTSVAARIAYLSKYAAFGMLLFQRQNFANRYAQIAQPFLQLGLGLLGLGAGISSLFGISAIGAILTFLNFIYLPVVAWVGGRCLPADSLRRYAWWVVVLAVAMSPLAVIQFYSSPSSRLNRYSTEGEYVSTSGISERVRATGTFSYITGLGVFANVAVWAGLVAVSLARTARQRWLSYAGLIAAFVCGFVTVSRAAALIGLATLAAWAMFGGSIGRKVQAVLAIGVVGGLALLAVGGLETAADISTTVYRRHEWAAQGAGGDTLLHRLWYQFTLPLDALSIAPMGNGIGTEQIGRLGASSNMRAGWTFESPWGRTIMEVGIAGFLGLVVTWGIPLAPLHHAYRRIPAGGTKAALATTAAALGLQAFVGYQFNHVAAYFFWSIAACVVALGNSPPRRAPTSADPQNVAGKAANGLGPGA